jgi:hypothetical protein
MKQKVIGRICYILGLCLAAIVAGLGTSIGKEGDQRGYQILTSFLAYIIFMGTSLVIDIANNSKSEDQEIK